MATAYRPQFTPEQPAAARPLRIALFSGNYNYVRDGANQALNKLVAFLESQGNIVRVYSPTSDTPAFEPAGTLVSVPSVRIPGRAEYRVARALSASLKRDVRAFAPDIIHLSAPDPLTPINLFGLLPFDPPAMIALGVLPIILGITMFVQFRLNPQPMDEIQQKVFAWMPWLFMFMMAPFAAGLQLYWIVNNLVSILQQWVLLKKYPAPAPAPAK